MDWKDKRIFLTGASSGIGEGLAVAMAEKGAIVALVARREEELTRIAEQITAKNGVARVFAVDVTDAESLSKAAQEFRDEFGHIDILIANAGIGGNDQLTREYDPASVKKLIDINLLGAVNSIHAVLKPMQERKSGHLVAISSLAGFRGLPKSAAYSASKGAMTNFFESVRLDQAA
nr:SDR family NAD(P)-dependent oxidoreductase [Pyrinomonadaceae bacterium]